MRTTQDFDRRQCHQKIITPFNWHFKIQIVTHYHSCNAFPKNTHDSSIFSILIFNHIFVNPYPYSHIKTKIGFPDFDSSHNTHLHLHFHLRLSGMIKFNFKIFVIHFYVNISGYQSNIIQSPKSGNTTFVIYSITIILIQFAFELVKGYLGLMSYVKCLMKCLNECMMSIAHRIHLKKHTPVSLGNFFI